MLSFLFSLSVVLFLGLLGSRLAKYWGWPSALVLWVIGALLGRVSGVGFSAQIWFVVAIGVLSLAVFDSVSRLHISKGVEERKMALHFVGYSVLMVGFLAWGLLAHFAHSLSVLGFVLIFVFLVIGSDRAALGVNGVWSFLSEEGMWLGSLTLLIPFIVLGFLERTLVPVGVLGVILPLHPFVHDAIVGIGTGLLLGVIFFKWIHAWVSSYFTPVWLWTGVLGGFILSEVLGGSGVLAVGTMALLFGHGFVNGKKELQEFTHSFSEAVEVAVILLSGMVLKISFSGVLLGEGLFLFAALVLARFLAVRSARLRFSALEKGWLSVFMPKGFYSAAALLGLAVLGPSSLLPWLQAAWLVMVLCLVLSLGVYQDKKLGRI
ncbi:MAG: hypothetical protein AABX70_01965 [Nanoarchaeota archaeon]